MLFGLGVALASGDLMSTFGAAALVAGILLQVLLVEEPHLAGAHGQAYADYQACSGRFLPRLPGPRRYRGGAVAGA